MVNKRTKIEIIFDILETIYKNNEVKITFILHKANLSHPKFKEYSEELFEKNLIEEVFKKKQKYYKLTEKGIKYYNKLIEIKKFMNIFEF